MLALLEQFFIQFGYLAVFFVLILCGFGIPIPEDVTLVAGGVISGLGYTDVHIMAVVGMAGVLAGDGIMFLLGRHYGDRLLRFKPVARLLNPKRYAQVQQKFDRYGNRVLFVARFLPGLRSPMFLAAGMSRKISFWRWLAMDGLAAALSVPAQKTKTGCSNRFTASNSGCMPCASSAAHGSAGVCGANAGSFSHGATNSWKNAAKEDWRAGKTSSPKPFSGCLNTRSGSLKYIAIP